MSIQSALNFIQYIRSNAAAREAILALGYDATLASLVEQGASAGFNFTAQDLARAHGLDWKMRAQVYSSRADALSPVNDAQK